MATHLYTQFLNNKEEYFRNVDFWKSMIYTLLSVEKISFSEYLTSTKTDGSLYLDGNPIFNFRVNNSNRAVRIIQEPIESKGIEFSAWLNTIEYTEESKLEELVISMELSNETALMAMELINAWIINKFSKPKMIRFIDKLFAIKDNLMMGEHINK